MTEIELLEYFRKNVTTIKAKDLILAIVKADPELKEDWVVYGFWIQGKHPYGAAHEAKYGHLACGGCGGVGCRFCNPA